MEHNGHLYMRLTGRPGYLVDFAPAISERPTLLSPYCDVLQPDSSGGRPDTRDVGHTKDCTVSGWVGSFHHDLKPQNFLVLQQLRASFNWACSLGLAVCTEVASVCRDTGSLFDYE